VTNYILTRYYNNAGGDDDMKPARASSSKKSSASGSKANIKCKVADGKVEEKKAKRQKK
jgi:hypothetical protein